jgi:hypothetical protein
MSTLVLGILAILVALTSGIALFAGIITFFIKPDAKHAKAVIGMSAGGVALGCVRKPKF